MCSTLGGVLSVDANFFFMVELSHYTGSNGNTTRLGRSASAKTVFTATRLRLALPSGSPVFGLTSNFGKLLDEMSSLMRCPGMKRFAVGNSVIRILPTSRG